MAYESEVPKVYLDYSYLNAQGKLLTKEEADGQNTITVLGAVDKQSGACCALQCIEEALATTTACTSSASGWRGSATNA